MNVPTFFVTGACRITVEAEAGLAAAAGMAVGRVVSIGEHGPPPAPRGGEGYRVEVLEAGGSGQAP